MWGQYRGGSMLQDRPHREGPQALHARPERAHEEKRAEGSRDLDGRIQTQHQLGLELAVRGIEQQWRCPLSTHGMNI